jgi:hypothetical protein
VDIRKMSWNNTGAGDGWGETKIIAPVVAGGGWAAEPIANLNEFNTSTGGYGDDDAGASAAGNGGGGFSGGCFNCGQEG